MTIFCAGAEIYGRYQRYIGMCGAIETGNCINHNNDQRGITMYEFYGLDLTRRRAGDVHLCCRLGVFHGW